MLNKVSGTQNRSSYTAVMTISFILRYYWLEILKSSSRALRKQKKKTYNVPSGGEIILGKQN